MKLNYREHVFEFEPSPDTEFAGRLVLDDNQRQLLVALTEPRTSRGIWMRRASDCRPTFSSPCRRGVAADRKATSSCCVGGSTCSAGR